MSARLLVARGRVLLALCRPALLLLFGLVVSVGVAQAGRPGELGPALAALVPSVAFLVFAVAVNDLADVAIDRVNLPGDRGRPLVTGLADRADMVVVAATAAVLAVGAAIPLGVAGGVVVLGGLVFAAAYSVAPVRLAGRGLVAPLTLPLGFVAVPFLLALLAGRGRVVTGDLLVLAGLYVAFIGRLLLKDLRDVRGDALFGKRTFLLRRGRRWTIGLAGACWLAGSAVLALATSPSGPSVVALAVPAIATVGVLVALVRSRSARRDAALVMGAAVLGRTTLVVLVAHRCLLEAGAGAVRSAVVLGAVVLAGLVATAHHVARGPITRATVPAAWELRQDVSEAGATLDRQRARGAPR